MQTETADHLGPRNFARLAKYIEGYCGIKMPPAKMGMLEGRLRRRLRPTGQPNLAQYCDYLFEQDGLQSESVHLIDAVTTNKTDFFREPEHFRLLFDELVPDMLGRFGAARPLKFWSAACSIGAEPYTLAMLLADFARTNGGLRSAVFATDICTEALQTAINGIYPEPMIAPVPPDLRKRYVMRPKDRTRGEVRIAPEIRAMVQFARLNLMRAPYPFDQDMDVIFCRNILIYFDKPTQHQVLTQLISQLRPGGYLFLGHSESLAGFDLPLELVGSTTFRVR